MEHDRGRLENWYVSERFHYVLMLSIVCIWNMTEVAWKIGMYQGGSTRCFNAVHSLYTQHDRGRLENWYVSERFHYVLMLSIVCLDELGPETLYLRVNCPQGQDTVATVSCPR